MATCAVNTNYASTSGLDEMGEFLELVLLALGHNISYDDFKKMSKEEKIGIIRDIKIKSVLNV